jgi:hypothetical protein
VAARIAVGLVAVVVLAWLGVMERDHRLYVSGVTGAGKVRTPADLARAEADLRAARLLNPDISPDLSRAILYVGAGRARQATALAEDVLRREPDNLRAWGLLYSLSHERDPAAAERALAARRRLDPLNARSR